MQRSWILSKPNRPKQPIDYNESAVATFLGTILVEVKIMKRKRSERCLIVERSTPTGNEKPKTPRKKDRTIIIDSGLGSNAGTYA